MPAELLEDGMVIGSSRLRKIIDKASGIIIDKIPIMKAIVVDAERFFDGTGFPDAP